MSAWWFTVAYTLCAASMACGFIPMVSNQLQCSWTSVTGMKVYEGTIQYNDSNAITGLKMQHGNTKSEVNNAAYMSKCLRHTERVQLMVSTLIDAALLAATPHSYFC